MKYNIPTPPPTSREIRFYFARPTAAAAIYEYNNNINVHTTRVRARDIYTSSSINY